MNPALDRHAATARPITPNEAAMLRAIVDCSLLRASKHKATIRALHSRLQPDGVRTITPGEASILRACVIACAAKLNPAIVTMAGVEL